MKTTITNEQLLQISSIKDLTSIEYKDLYLPATNGKKQLIPGFIITDKICIGIASCRE